MSKPPTIGCVCHFHAERHALPSFIQAARAMFDEVVLVSSPRDGTPHCEESLAIARESGCKVILDTISQGFGALRTRCIGYSSCEWVMILDADERVWTEAPLMTCRGDEKFPEARQPQLQVQMLFDMNTVTDQHRLLRLKIEEAEKNGDLAVCLSRRHWMDSPDGWGAPAQNWHNEPDWQLRLVKNTPWLCYDPTVRMHERLLDTRTWGEPKFLRVTWFTGPFIDHYSHHFCAMEPEQNSEDIATYEELAPGCTKDMWISHQPKA